jgi:hypothetical protein
MSGTKLLLLATLSRLTLAEGGDTVGAMNRALSVVFFGVTLALAGCASGIHVDTLSPKPAKLMVATKVDVPLYIVLDSAKVQDVYQVDGFGTVSGMHAFVERDVRGIMSEYFSDVKVISSASGASGDKFVLADVSIVRLTKQTVVRAGVGHKILELNWNFALRTNDAQDYMFSFAGIAQSEAPAKSLAEVGTRLIENSLTGLLDEWAASDAFSKLRDWSSGSAPTSEEPGDVVQ